MANPALFENNYDTVGRDEGREEFHKQRWQLIIVYMYTDRKSEDQTSSSYQSNTDKYDIESISLHTSWTIRAMYISDDKFYQFTPQHCNCFSFSMFIMYSWFSCSACYESKIL